MKGVLAPLFESVDLLEQNERFLATSRDFVASDKLKSLINTPIQVHTALPRV